jgi:choline dehydrogenase-like flavoprotein
LVAALDAAVRRIVRHGAGWISIPLAPQSLKKRIDQMRDNAGRDVSLAMVFAPGDVEYWAAVQNLGFTRLGLQLPTQPLDHSLRLLDDYAAKVAQYRSWRTGQSSAMGIGDNVVADSRLGVRGVHRLRVVDASIMPTIVNANTSAVIAIAERAAAVIRQR